MSDLANYLENALVNHLFRNTDLTRPANVYLALHTGSPGETGANNEVSGNAYARVAVPTGASSEWAAPSDGLTENLNTESFPTATPSGWGEILACSLWDAASGGNCWMWGWLGNQRWAFTATNAGDLFTAPGHGLSNNDRVVLKTAGDSSIPTGVSVDTVYYVIGVSGATFQLSLTQGGAAIALSSDGGGLVLRLQPKTVGVNDTFTFPAGNLDAIFS